ncbi:hypothetical protein PSTG_04102 [Puccinia striiformis f. sp. tritici PST-78]|uniref:Uncharacterized protein n=2 Tax=Puccinia striiformis TaxID=27350 RepID=A0A0L0VUC6_9BASI|nr:hypothetical protein PSTG_04102 [Puccinia striiformis f. sp. tritici PST-78]
MEVATRRRDRMGVDDEQRIEESPIDQEMSSHLAAALPLPCQNTRIPSLRGWPPEEQDNHPSPPGVGRGNPLPNAQLLGTGSAACLCPNTFQRGLNRGAGVAFSAN